MDGDGITMTPVGSPPPSLPDAVGPQEEDPKTEEEEAEAHSDVVPPPVILTDELREKIIRQVEYYFSDENLPTDKFLMKYVKKNKEGFVPVAVIASFRKMRKLVQDNSLVVTALRESSQLVLSSDGKRVKRIDAMDVKDTKSHIVVVENLPEDCSTERLERIFGEVGRIKSICIRDAEMMVSGKVHGVVEYETAGAAEKAVATLNDEKDWRSGMRVELLVKRMGKYGLARKGWKGNAGDESLDDAVEGDKIGRKSRGRHGRGSGSGSRGGGGVNKAPPPGPKMPDGTKGFIMGRGRPPASN